MTNKCHRHAMQKEKSTCDRQFFLFQGKEEREQNETHDEGDTQYV